MIKFVLVYMLWRLIVSATGNPLLAIIILVVLYYFFDRRFIGFTPNISALFRRSARASTLRRQLSANAHDMPAKMELVQVYNAQHRYHQALELLSSLPVALQEDPDVLYDTGVCHLGLGHLENGERSVRQAIAKQPGLRYGEPYLKLGAMLAKHKPDVAAEALREYLDRNHSSCEGAYRLAQIYAKSGSKQEARQVWRQCTLTYRGLPKFRKRVERKWVTLARLRLLGL